MKVLVPIKHVGSLSGDYELPDSGLVNRADINWSINEWDEFSVEAAIQLRDTAAGGEVTVVTIGDGETIEGLVSSLARGADRAVRVWDPALADADPITVAQVLAAIIKREQPDVVLCGAKSADEGHGATGVATAALAGLPHIAVVSEIKLETRTSLVVARELEKGLRQRLRVRLPALLTLQTGVNEPRYVAVSTMNAARSRPIETFGLADLHIDDDRPRAHVVRRIVSPQDSHVEMLSGSAAQAAEAILDIVAERTGARVAEPA
jgi:electron transfer flavoprotein beta subunit